MKYKAIKDVPYYGIKAGEIYEGAGGLVWFPYIHEFVKPFLELGALEEYKPLPRLTVKNVKEGEIYWYVEMDKSSGVNWMPWNDSSFHKNHSRFGMFRTEKEAQAHFMKLCEYSDKLLANDETV